MSNSDLIDFRRSLYIDGLEKRLNDAETRLYQANEKLRLAVNEMNALVCIPVDSAEFECEHCGCRCELPMDAEHDNLCQMTEIFDRLKTV